MTRIRIAVVQEFDLPANAEIADGPAGKLIKLGEVFLSPSLELLASPGPLSKIMNFREPDEEILDQLMVSLAQENVTIELI